MYFYVTRYALDMIVRCHHKCIYDTKILIYDRKAVDTYILCKYNLTDI